ncbi:unnamed protein product [Coffea canephora]|uniref:Uncharacterized protein n=2 Tax=Coffea TaxID=13442 RepID=A0A068U6V6_COFCA|nr:unnamed protein product [Coffea canephora]
MSRCFPFPPPGYEKKTRPDEDANLLLKEKPREKKHKKDKKDKEKKERREKDKEKSSEKHREKKDKKHRHKDKKEKSSNKEEKKTSDEKTIVAFSDHQNSEKFGLTGLEVGETQDSRLFVDLGNKVRKDDGAKELQILERITNRDLTPPGKVLEHKIGVLDDGNKKFRDKREKNRIPNGQTVKINGIGFANGFVHNFPPKIQKNIEGSSYQEDKVTEKQKERKDSKKHKGADGRGDKEKGRDREKKSKSKDKNRKREKEKAKEFSSLMPSKLGEHDNNARDFKNDEGSYLFKETNVQNGILGKRKEPEMDGCVNGHEIQNNKLPRLVSSSCQVVQTGNTIESSSKGNQLNLEKESTLQKHKPNAKFLSSVSPVENGRKLEMTQIPINIASERQEAVSKHGKASDSPSSLKPPSGTGRNSESCQFVGSFTELEQGVVSNNTKDFTKVLSMQPVAENGRKLGSSQFNNLNAAERQAGACIPKLSEKGSRSNGFVVPKLDERASKINGSVELKKPKACSMEMSSACLEDKEIVEKYLKPPHPDAKYLSQVLSLPKVEWSDVDDQKWLFSREDHQAKNPKYVSPVIEESEQVWAEALRIESADVIALPYVIPY